MLDFELQAPNDAEVNGIFPDLLKALTGTVFITVESLDKGSTYVAYTADDCAIFLAALPLHSTDEPNYEVCACCRQNYQLEGRPGPMELQGLIDGSGRRSL